MWTLHQPVSRLSKLISQRVRPKRKQLEEEHAAAVTKRLRGLLTDDQSQPSSHKDSLAQRSPSS